MRRYYTTTAVDRIAAALYDAPMAEDTQDTNDAEAPTGGPTRHRPRGGQDLSLGLPKLDQA